MYFPCMCMYSPGARCAIAIQPVLHELGCLPVSKMVHLPAPQAIVRIVILSIVILSIGILSIACPSP